MINYLNNKPNARFWVLKLIKDNIKIGSKLIKTTIERNRGDDLAAQGFVDGNAKSVLLLNKRNKIVRLMLTPEFKGAQVTIVDGNSGDNEPKTVNASNEFIDLQPFAVALLKPMK